MDFFPKIINARSLISLSGLDFGAKNNKSIQCFYLRLQSTPSWFYSKFALKLCCFVVIWRHYIAKLYYNFFFRKVKIEVNTQKLNFSLKKAVLIFRTWIKFFNKPLLIKKITKILWTIFSNFRNRWNFDVFLFSCL